MKIYICELCGYEFNSRDGDGENGIAPDTALDELPSDWVCPNCAAGKEDFETVENDEE